MSGARAALLIAMAACATGAHASRAQAQSSSPALSAPERALVKSVDAHNADALALLIKVVNINSGTMNFAGVRQVGDVFRAQLDSLGFQDAMGGRCSLSSRGTSRWPSIRARGRSCS